MCTCLMIFAEPLAILVARVNLLAGLGMMEGAWAPRAPATATVDFSIGHDLDQAAVGRRWRPAVQPTGPVESRISSV